MLVDAGVDRSRLFLVDAAGLLHDRRSDLVEFQVPFAQPWDAVDGWADPGGPTRLETTVGAVVPHVLIGVSGQPKLFGEAMIRRLADDDDTLEARVDRCWWSPDYPHVAPG